MLFNCLIITVITLIDFGVYTSSQSTPTNVPSSTTKLPQVFHFAVKMTDNNPDKRILGLWDYEDYDDDYFHEAHKKPACKQCPPIIAQIPNSRANKPFI